MSKKKILIIMPGMFIGGAERSLLGLLEALDYEYTEVSLFLYRHEGEFMRYIPSEVNILPAIPEYATFDVPVSALLKNRQIAFAFARVMAKAAATIRRRSCGGQYSVWIPMQFISKYLQPLLPKIPGNYDLAIMFLGVADTLLNKVSAKIKAAWCHTDYDSLYPDKKMDEAVYERLDWIVNVSDSCTSIFKKHYPHFSEKAITIENILPARTIRREAHEPIEAKVSGKGIRLLSIGRFNSIKNFHNIPYMCRKLRQKGMDVSWDIIGYGQEEARICAAIAEEGMEEYVTVLGKKDNPYPYIEQCDLYVQPSLLEGKSVTVREAQLLGKPVVITRYATSASQLEENVDGVIVPMDIDACVAGIAALLHDKEKMERLSETCLSRDYSGADEVEKIYRLMENEQIKDYTNAGKIQ